MRFYAKPSTRALDYIWGALFPRGTVQFKAISCWGSLTKLSDFNPVLDTGRFGPLLKKLRIDVRY